MRRLSLSAIWLCYGYPRPCATRYAPFPRVAAQGVDRPPLLHAALEEARPEVRQGFLARRGRIFGEEFGAE